MGSYIDSLTGNSSVLILPLHENIARALIMIRGTNCTRISLTSFMNFCTFLGLARRERRIIICQEMFKSISSPSLPSLKCISVGGRGAAAPPPQVGQKSVSLEQICSKNNRKFRQLFCLLSSSI